MRINDSLCPSPMQWGVGQGEVPRPHAGNGRSMFTSLIARCPVAVGWGMGVYSPLCSGIGLPLPSHHGGARGLEALELR